MARKSDKEKKPAEQPAAASPPEVRQPMEFLSWRWYLSVFLACFAAGAFLLWGVYVPVVNNIAQGHIDQGDKFFAHAEKLRSSMPNPGEQAAELEEIDALLAALIDPEVRPTPPERRPARIPRAMGLEGKPERLAALLKAALERNGWADEFSAELSDVEARARKMEDAIDILKTAEIPDPNEEPFSGAVLNSIPPLVTSAKSLRDLFFVEQAYDRAMQQYMEAIITSRLWIKPRTKIAELYATRGWNEFAMEELLKIIKLDVDGWDHELLRAVGIKGFGAEGQAALTRLHEFVGKNPEAELRLGHAYLLLEDYDRAAEYLDAFVENVPVHIYAPKAWEVLQRLEEGDLRYARRFIDNEVWL